MEYVAHSCCKPNKCINEWNDAHAYEMQVQLWEPNTWGVTFPLPAPSRRALRSCLAFLLRLKTLALGSSGTATMAATAATLWQGLMCGSVAGSEPLQSSVQRIRLQWGSLWWSGSSSCSSGRRSHRRGLAPPRPRIYQYVLLLLR
jgi:hypothetical protein